MSKKREPPGSLWQRDWESEQGDVVPSETHPCPVQRAANWVRLPSLQLGGGASHKASFGWCCTLSDASSQESIVHATPSSMLGGVPSRH